jgi:hypothetical protein
MPSKLDLLHEFAKKHDVNFDLVLQIFEVERARLRPGEAEENLRREEIEEIITNWADNHPGKDRS